MQQHLSAQVSDACSSAEAIMSRSHLSLQLRAQTAIFQCGERAKRSKIPQRFSRLDFKEGLLANRLPSPPSRVRSRTLSRSRAASPGILSVCP